MRILYVALDQTVPGTLGGSVHVQAVAEGLAALGPRRARRRRSPAARWPRRPGRTGTRWRRRSGAPTLRWRARGAVDAPGPRSRRRVDHRALLQLRRRGRARGAPPRRAGRARSQRADRRLSRDRRRRALDRALLVEPMRRWRDRLCRLTSLFVTPSADDPADVGRSRAGARSRMGRRRRSTSGPDAPGASAVHAATRRASCASSPARFARGTAPCTSGGGARAAARGRRPPVRRGLHRRRPGARGGRARRRAACRACIFTGALAARRAAGGARGRRHRRRAVRSDAARAAAARLLLVAAEDLRVHGRRACRWSRPRCRASTGSSRTDARACSTIRQIRAALDRALVALADPALRRRWARPRARASSATSAGTAHCAALDARLRALVTAMSAPLRVLIVTDSFPPVCGGSGWSTWELVARPASRAGITSRS